MIEPLMQGATALLGMADSRNVAKRQASALASDRLWAEQQAQTDRDFQERMSSTAYQRAMDDMRKAGLNPALMYQQGGASSPSGSRADTSSTGQQGTTTAQRLLYDINTRTLNQLNNATERQHKTSMKSLDILAGLLKG